MVTVHVNTERTWRGGERQMCTLARGLQARGHAAHVVCRPDSLCEAGAKRMGLPTYPIRALCDVDAAAAWKLARLLNRLGAEIVHAHTSRTHLICAIAARLARRRPACIVHRRVDFSIHKMPLRLSGLKYRWGVDRYIAVTAAVRDVMVRDGIPREKISVIHSSVDLSRFENVERKPGLRAEWGVPQNAPLVGTAGALVGHKAHSDLLDAAARVLREKPETHFVILGEGPLRPALEAHARALRIQDRVHMPGERSDIPSCLAEFDVFCMSSRMEGLGGAALEAMAMRRPVASTDAGGLAEVARDGQNALVAPAADSAALANCILRLLNDRALAARLVEAGRRTVEAEFAADMMVDKTLALYGELLAPHG